MPTHTLDNMAEIERCFIDNAHEVIESKLLEDVEADCYGFSRKHAIELLSQVCDDLWQGVKYDECAPVSQAELHAKDALASLDKTGACIKCLLEQVDKMKRDLIEKKGEQNDTND